MDQPRWLVWIWLVLKRIFRAPAGPEVDSEPTAIHSIDEHVRTRLLSSARTRLARYPHLSRLTLVSVEKRIRAAQDWRGLIWSYVRAAASLEEGDLPALGHLEAGLSELSGVKGLERLAARLRDEPEQLTAIAAELRAAGELRKEYPGCEMEFAPRGDSKDIIVTPLKEEAVYVEVKHVRDLEVFSETTNCLGACSLLDPRFRAFFSFSGTELGDADFQSKRKEVRSTLDAWVAVLDRKLKQGADLKLSAARESISDYPFHSLEVIYRWNRFAVGAGGHARILPGYHPGLVARELVRLNHLSRLVNEISGAYRQLARARGDQPRNTDQIRMYGCIPAAVLDFAEPHEAPEIEGQIESIINAWGIRHLVRVHLSVR